MPKSRRSKGKHPHSSKKAKAIERQMSGIQRTATPPAPRPAVVDSVQPEAVPGAPTAPKPAAASAEVHARAITTQYHFIVDELKKIGILAGIILVILIILSIILS